MPPRAILENEVRFLLGSEQIRDPAPYNAILAAIAGGETKFNGIQQLIGVERGSAFLLPADLTGARLHSARISFRRKLGAQGSLSRCRSLSDLLVSLCCSFGQRFAILQPDYGLCRRGSPAPGRIYGLVGFRRNMRAMDPTERPTAPLPQRLKDGSPLESGWPNRDNRERPHGRTRQRNVSLRGGVHVAHRTRYAA